MRNHLEEEKELTPVGMQGEKGAQDVADDTDFDLPYEDEEDEELETSDEDEEDDEDDERA